MMTRLDASFSWEVLQPTRGTPLDAEALRARLTTPSSGPPLRFEPGRSVTIVVPDATRATGVRACVGALLDHADAAGIGPERLRFLVAGGQHRPPTRDELGALLGNDHGITVHVHDCEDDGALRDCGHTTRGTPVHVNRWITDHEQVVVVGGITPHYFAGFTGGWKGVCPAAAGRATILANHRRAVDPAAPNGVQATCAEGCIDGNPVFDDLVEAGRLAARPFLVNVVLDAAGQIIDCVTGEVDGAHAAGRTACRAHCGVAAQPAPVVWLDQIAPGRTLDFIQAHKVLRQGAALVEDGGWLLASIPCGDGVGSDTLLDWMALPPDGLTAAVYERYTPHGHTALSLRSLLRRIRIGVVTELPDAVCHRLGLTRRASAEEAFELARAEVAGTRALHLPGAGVLLPTAI